MATFWVSGGKPDVYVEGVCLRCLRTDHPFFDHDHLYTNLSRCECGGYIKTCAGLNNEEGKAKVRREINRLLTDQNWRAEWIKDREEWEAKCAEWAKEKGK